MAYYKTNSNRNSNDFRNFKALNSHNPRYKYKKKRNKSSYWEYDDTKKFKYSRTDRPNCRDQSILNNCESSANEKQDTDLFYFDISGNKIDKSVISERNLVNDKSITEITNEDDCLRVNNRKLFKKNHNRIKSETDVERDIINENKEETASDKNIFDCDSSDRHRVKKNRKNKKKVDNLSEFGKLNFVDNDIKKESDQICDKDRYLKSEEIIAISNEDKEVDIYSKKRKKINKNIGIATTDLDYKSEISPKSSTKKLNNASTDYMKSNESVIFIETAKVSQTIENGENIFNKPRKVKKKKKKSLNPIIHISDCEIIDYVSSNIMSDTSEENCNSTPKRKLRQKTSDNTKNISQKILINDRESDKLNVKNEFNTKKKKRKLCRANSGLDSIKDNTLSTDDVHKNNKHPNPKKKKYNESNNSTYLEEESFKEYSNFESIEQDRCSDMSDCSKIFDLTSEDFVESESIVKSPKTKKINKKNKIKNLGTSMTTSEDECEIIDYVNTNPKEKNKHNTSTEPDIHKKKKHNKTLLTSDNSNTEDILNTTKKMSNESKVCHVSGPDGPLGIEVCTLDSPKKWKRYKEVSSKQQNKQKKLHLGKEEHHQDDDLEKHDNILKEERSLDNNEITHESKDIPHRSHIIFEDIESINSEKNNLNDFENKSKIPEKINSSYLKKEDMLEEYSVEFNNFESLEEDQHLDKLPKSKRRNKKNEIKDSDTSTIISEDKCEIIDCITSNPKKKKKRSTSTEPDIHSKKKHNTSMETNDSSTDDILNTSKKMSSETNVHEVNGSDGLLGLEDCALGYPKKKKGFKEVGNKQQNKQKKLHLDKEERHQDDNLENRDNILKEERSLDNNDAITYINKDIPQRSHIIFDDHSSDSSEIIISEWKYRKTHTEIDTNNDTKPLKHVNKSNTPTPVTNRTNLNLPNETNLKLAYEETESIDIEENNLDDLENEPKILETINSSYLKKEDVLEECLIEFNNLESVEDQRSDISDKSPKSKRKNKKNKIKDSDSSTIISDDKCEIIDYVSSNSKKRTKRSTSTESDIHSKKHNSTSMMTSYSNTDDIVNTSNKTLDSPALVKTETDLDTYNVSCEEIEAANFIECILLDHVSSNEKRKRKRVTSVELDVQTTLEKKHKTITENNEDDGNLENALKNYPVTSKDNNSQQELLEEEYDMGEYNLVKPEKKKHKSSLIRSNSENRITLFELNIEELAKNKHCQNIESENCDISSEKCIISDNNGTTYKNEDGGCECYNFDEDLPANHSKIISTTDVTNPTNKSDTGVTTNGTDLNSTNETTHKSEHRKKQANVNRKKKSPISRISVFAKIMQRKNTNSEKQPIIPEISTDPEDLEDDIEKLKDLTVLFPFSIPPLHALAVRTTVLMKADLEKFQEMNLPIKMGPFTKEEDEMIIENWKQLCKEHGLRMNPSIFVKFPKRLKMEIRLDILRYIAHGLDDRLLHRVYIRFRHLLQKDKIKRGRFTPEEDKILLEFLAETNSDHPFSDLAKLLNRTGCSVETRYKRLTSNNKVTQWTPEMVDRLVEALMKITKCEKVKQLKRRKFTPIEWKELSKKLDNIPVIKLKRAWNVTIYPRLFSKEVDRREMKEEIIHLLCDRKETNWKTVNWKEIAKYFKGCTPEQIYAIFRHLTYFHVPEEKRSDLKECLTFLKYKVLKYDMISTAHKLKKFVIRNGHVTYDSVDTD